MRSRDGRKTMSPKEVARMLGLHVGTVYRWISEGRLKARRLSRYYVVWEEDARAMLTPATARPSAGVDWGAEHAAATARLREAGWAR